MALNNSILNYLSTPEEFATPQQIADAKVYADSMRPKEMPKIQHLAQGGDYVLRALLGNLASQRNYNQERKDINTLNPYSAANGNTATSAVTSPTKMASADPTLAAVNGDSLTDFLHKQEGFSPKAYSDYKQRSIGYGTRAQPGETSITPEEAEKRLQTEVSKARGLVQAFGVPMTKKQEDALTDLTYNAGSEWMASGLGAAVKSGNWQKAAELFTHYNRAGGVPNKGLLERRKALAANLLDTTPQSNSVAQSVSPVETGTIPAVSNPASPQAPRAIPPNAAATVPAADASLAAKPPVQVASADGAIPMAALPPEMTGAPPPPTPPTPMVPPAPEIMDGKATPTVAPGSAPQQIAQNYIPSESVHNGLEHKLPPVLPKGLGITNEMYLAGRRDPAAFQALIDRQTALYSPQYTEVEGGTAWVIPATGERGLIVKPRYSKAKIGDIELDTIARPGDNGELGSPQLQVPGGNGGGNSGASSQQGNLGTGAGGTPGFPANPTTPGGFPAQPTLDNLQQYNREQKAATKGAEETATAQAKRYDDMYAQINDKTNNAYDLLSKVQMQERLLKDPKLYTGFGSNMVLNARKLLAGLGIDPGAASPTEVYNKIRADSNLDSLKLLQGLGQIRVAEIQLINQANGDMSNTRQANLAVNEISKRVISRAIHVGELAKEYTADHGRLDAGFDKQMAEYKRSNPLFTEDEMKQYKKTFHFDKDFSQPPGQQDIGSDNKPVRKFNRATGYLE